MPKHGKKYTAAKKLLAQSAYGVEEALAVVRKAAFAKFDETVEVAMLLGVDPKHADQMVRGRSCSRTERARASASWSSRAARRARRRPRPAPISSAARRWWPRSRRLARFRGGRRDSGHDEGRRRLGKVWGPRLDAEPKTGTVTFDVGAAVSEIKAGKVEFRVDKTAIIHVPVGKLSFPHPKLVDNAQALIQAVLRAKPPAAKGKYVRSIYISSTMGPGVPVDPVSSRPFLPEVTRESLGEDCGHRADGRSVPQGPARLCDGLPGMTANQSVELRRRVRRAGGTYRVVKNRWRGAPPPGRPRRRSPRTWWGRAGWRVTPRTPSSWRRC